MRRYIVALDGSTGTKIYLRQLLSQRVKNGLKKMGNVFTNKREESLRFPTEKAARNTIEKLKKMPCPEKPDAYGIESYDEGM